MASRSAVPDSSTGGATTTRAATLRSTAAGPVVVGAATSAPAAQGLDGSHLAVAAARRQAGQGIEAGDTDAADVLERFVHRPIDPARRQHVGDRRGAVGGARGDHLDEAVVADLRLEEFAVLGGGCGVGP